MSRTEKRVSVLALAGLLATAVAAMGVAETTKAIEARHEAMGKIGDALKAMAGIARNQTPFSAELVEEQATIVVEQLKKAATLFPPGSDQGDTETYAKPEVWSDAAGFAEALKDAETAAVALRSVSQEDEFRPAFGKLAGTCKSCHERYRRPRP